MDTSLTHLLEQNPSLTANNLVLTATITAEILSRSLRGIPEHCALAILLRQALRGLDRPNVGPDSTILVFSPSCRILLHHSHELTCWIKNFDANKPMQPISVLIDFNHFTIYLHPT